MHKVGAVDAKVSAVDAKVGAVNASINAKVNAVDTKVDRIEGMLEKLLAHAAKTNSSSSTLSEILRYQIENTQSGRFPSCDPPALVYVLLIVGCVS